MLASVTRISLGFAFCSMFWACDNCVKYQDIAIVGAGYYTFMPHIDSTVMIVNDSIIGCGNPRYGSMIGSKTHRIKFPVNVHIKLFAEDSLWKELSIEMHRNTMLMFYGEFDCLNSISPRPNGTFYDNTVEAKESNRYIDSYLDDDYCWLFEKMADGSFDNDRCVEMGVSGPQDFCN